METENRKPSESIKFEKIGDLVGIYQRGQKWYSNYQVEGRQRRQSLKTYSKKEARRRAVRLEAEDRRPAVNSDEPCRPADLERAAAALSVGIYCASLR